MYSHITNLATFRQAIGYMARSGNDKINKPVSRTDLTPILNTFTNPEHDIGRSLGYYTDDFVIGSFLVRYSIFIESLIVEHSKECKTEEDELAVVEKIQRWIFADLTVKIFRGPEKSSNPMTAVVSAYELDAARKVLEMLCGVSDHTFRSPSVIDDIFGGMKRRQEERDAAEAKVVSKVEYWKEDGHYHMAAVNAKGVRISAFPLRGITRKGDALTSIATFVREQRESGNQRSITVAEVN